MNLTDRLAAAKKHQPKHVRLLLVAEAPPCAGDRYFYFPDVQTQDALFRYVWQGLTGDKPERDDKPRQLIALRDAGVYLVDLHEDDIAKPKLKDLVPCVPSLVERVKALNPDHVVLIKALVYDAAYHALRDAGLPVIDERIPFPGSGQQKKFLEAFTRAAREAGVSIDAAVAS